MYRNTKNTWVPAMSTKKKKRAKHKKSKNYKKITEKALAPAIFHRIFT